VNLNQKKLNVILETGKSKYRENFEMVIQNVNNDVIDKNTIKSQKPKLSGDADNILLGTKFTLKNFKQVFNENEFLDLLLTTFYFTFLGRVGAIILGMLAAQLVNQKF
jgi:ABC-type sugar transport systems, permease components